MHNPSMRRILIALTLIVFATSCSGSGSSSGGGSNIPPVLKNLIVAFGAYDAATGKAGDFVFLASQSKVFDEFGVVVPNEGGNPVTLPTFEYKVDPNAQVVSPIDGIVTQVDYQEDQDDFSLILLPDADSNWFVNIDHVRNVMVSVGDTVTAGQQVGTSGTWTDELGRVELMVVQDNTTYYCPFDVFDTALKAEYEEKVTLLMNEWEDFKGDTTIYDQGAMVAPGCITSTLTDSDL